VCLHAGSSSTAPTTSSDAPSDTIGGLFFGWAMFAAVDWLYSKLPVRHPDLRICLSEGGVGWVAGLLDRGFVWVLAHPRGGGELGRRWYLDGKLLNKRNTFLDTLAVVDHVVANRWASPRRVAIRGGSAGGLLVGACMTMRPELFAAVVAGVPLSMLSPPCTTDAAAAITEWDE
jgi:oligopeptidase B